MTAAQKSLTVTPDVGSIEAAPQSGTVVNNYYNNDNSRTVNQTNNSPKVLTRLEIYRQTRNAINVRCFMRFTLIVENAAGDRINMTATANKYMISKIDGLYPLLGRFPHLPTPA